MEEDITSVIHTSRLHPNLSFRDGTDEYVWDHYQETVPMSTYLVAFVISNFYNEKSPPTGNNVTFQTWSRKSAFDQISYAKDIGPTILQFFETYFNVKYPLPKQVSIERLYQLTEIRNMKMAHYTFLYIFLNHLKISFLGYDSDP